MESRPTFPDPPVPEMVQGACGHFLRPRSKKDLVCASCRELWDRQVGRMQTGWPACCLELPSGGDDNGAMSLLAQLLVRRPEIGAALWELLVIIESSGRISVNAMAERLGADRRTVVTHLRSLEAAGLIARQPVRGLAHRYSVTFLTSDNGCH
jgi:DNA-binding transcriptional ArsR family regulator